MTGLPYFQPFDHRGSFQTQLFACEGKLTQEQAAQIAASKVVIYDGSEAAVDGGVPKEKAGILERKKLKRDNSFWPIKQLVPCYPAVRIWSKSLTRRKRSFIRLDNGDVWEFDPG